MLWIDIENYLAFWPHLGHQHCRYLRGFHDLLVSLKYQENIMILIEPKKMSLLASL